MTETFIYATSAAAGVALRYVQETIGANTVFTDMGKITDMSTPSTVLTIQSTTAGGMALASVFGNLSSLDQTVTTSGEQGIRNTATVQVFAIDGADLDIKYDAEPVNVVNDHGIFVLGRDQTGTPRHWELRTDTSGILQTNIQYSGVVIDPRIVTISGQTVSLSSQYVAQNTSSVVNLSGLYLASGLFLGSGMYLASGLSLASGLNIQAYVIQNPATALSGETPGSYLVTASSGQALAVNLSRKGAVLINISPNQINLALGTSANVSSGITLFGNGGVWVMDQYTYTTQAVQAISTLSGSMLTIQEFV